MNGFLGLRRLGRKWPPTVQTENELHMDAVVPNEDTDEVSKLSPLGSYRIDMSICLSTHVTQPTLSPNANPLKVAASSKDVAFSRY